MITPVSLRFTYETITPDSAAEGDADDRGWYQPGGWKFSIMGDDPAAAENRREGTPPYRLTGADAIDEILRNVGCVDSVTWSSGDDAADFYPANGDTDYQTGEETRIMAHVKCDPRLLRIIVDRLKGAP